MGKWNETQEAYYGGSESSAENTNKVLPILFNTDMVQAILDGRKTVTRRVCKDGNSYTEPDMNFYDVNRRTYAVHNYADKEHTFKLSIAERICPICLGDILYVRETWAFIPCIGCNGEYARPGVGMACYDIQAVEYDDGNSISDGCFIYRADCKNPERICWRPSIHMPKEAARIWLRVTDVQVERLQDMNTGDFLAEGVIIRPEALNYPTDAYMQAREGFIHTWNSTIKRDDLKRYDWDANPWVWVIAFERCKKPELKTPDEETEGRDRDDIRNP